MTAAVELVDLRKSFDGLCGVVEAAFGKNLLEGGLFLFVNRRRDLIALFGELVADDPVYLSVPQGCCPLACIEHGLLAGEHLLRRSGDVVSHGSPSGSPAS